VKERDCPAVVEGRYFPSLCAMQQTVGVCCEGRQIKDTTTTTTTATTSTTTTTTSTAPPSTTTTIPKEVRTIRECGVLEFKQNNVVDDDLGLMPRILDPSTPDWNPEFAQVGIVGGEEEEDGHQPWVAALGELSQKDGLVDFLCGATLVSDISILTSAHCVSNVKQEKLVVMLGETDLSSDAGEERRVWRDPASSRVEEYYRKTGA